MPLRWLVVVYCDFFRGTPLVLIAFVTTLGLPALAQGRAAASRTGSAARACSSYGVLALMIVYSAYVAEVYRAGIESVHPSQRMAARSLGLGYAQMMRYVILPQAIRRVIPPLLNDFIGLQKDTAIIGVVGVDRGRAAGADLLDDLRELHRLHGGRRALRATHDPAGALHGRPDP